MTKRYELTEFLPVLVLPAEVTRWVVRIRVAILALLVAAHTALAAPPAEPGAAAALPDIVAGLRNAVVNITVLKPPPTGRGETSLVLAAGRAERAFGSGFIIDTAGYIVTNRHVIEGALIITVTLNDERQFRARLISSNSDPDIALLKIETATTLPVVGWGNSDALRLGETVLAIGNPLGLATSVTVGVVSAVNRNVNSTLIDEFIQTDTSINQGNSGGPLFNLKGEVVGVTWAIVTPTNQGGSVGLGLAIPANTAAGVVRQMREHGRLRAGFPGMALQPLTPQLAEVLGLPNAQGGIISELPPGGPAARVGLREGDVVLQFGTHRTADSRAMMRQLADYPPGATMPVVVWRNGHEEQLNLVMEEFPPAFDPVGAWPLAELGARVDTPTLGLRLSPLDGPTRRSFAIAHDRPGLVVEGVAPNSLGAELGLARGDLVLRVADSIVPTVPAFTSALARHSAGRGTVMQVEMQGRVKWIVLPPRRD